MARRVELPALACFAKTEFFEFENRHDGKTIIELRDIDVVRPESCHAISILPGFGDAEPHQALGAHYVLMGMPFAYAQQVHRRLRQVACARARMKYAMVLAGRLSSPVVRPPTEQPDEATRKKIADVLRAAGMLHKQAA